MSLKDWNHSARRDRYTRHLPLVGWRLLVIEDRGHWWFDEPWDQDRKRVQLAAADGVGAVREVETIVERRLSAQVNELASS